MKLPLILAGLAIASLGFTAIASDNAGGCACGETSAASAPAAPAPVDVGNTKCIVELGDEPANKTIEYKGKLYHICCPMCIKKFNADPEKYVKALEADPAKYGVKK